MTLSAELKEGKRHHFGLFECWTSRTLVNNLELGRYFTIRLNIEPSQNGFYKKPNRLDSTTFTALVRGFSEKFEIREAVGKEVFVALFTLATHPSERDLVEYVRQTILLEKLKA